MGHTYTKRDFFTLLSPIVQQVRCEGSPLFPSVRLAQNWLETGGTIPSWNNLAGYKVGSGKPTPYWDGSSINTVTHEVLNGTIVGTTANWRAYTCLYNFYKDQDLLFHNTRYSAVRSAATPRAQCEALQTCGYATDPNYASKLISIIHTNNLIPYDDISSRTPDSLSSVIQPSALQEIQQSIHNLMDRLEALEHIVNVSGQQDPPTWATQAIEAAKAAGAISTSADKGRAELITLQILYNLGLLQMKNE